MKIVTIAAVVLAVLTFIVGHFVLQDVNASIDRLKPHAEEVWDAALSQTSKKFREEGKPISPEEMRQVESTTAAMAQGTTEAGRAIASLVCRVIAPVTAFLGTLLIGGLTILGRRVYEKRNKTATNPSSQN
jgi:hypothetical protein